MFGVAIAVVTGVVVAVASTAGAAVVFSGTFEDGTTNGWSKSGGSWTVVPDGSQVARQSNASSENARLFAGTTSWTAYTVRARVKPLSFGTGGYAGLLARASGSTKFYRLALVPGNLVQLQAVSGSTTTVLGGVSRAVATGTWYTLAIEVSGTTVRGTVDGALVAQATSSVSSTGRIGLQTVFATASFDDVVVTTGGTDPTATPTTVGPTTTPPTTVPPTTVPPTTTPPTTTPPIGALIVAPNGNDANPGTPAQPLLTIQRAHDLVTPGGTIALRAGTYAPTVTIKILKNGTQAQPITLTNYGGEHAVIDGENMPFTPGAVDASIPRADRGALHVEGDWWRFIGLEIIHGPYGIFGVDTNNGRYERLVTRDNYESGLHLQGASAGNQILDLDSYANRDPRNSGESADGLAIKEGSGAGNVVRGARLWFNSDDGFDAWEFLSPITIEDSVAYGNGFNRWGIPGYSGDGNGFKMGGGDVDLPAAHVTRNCMAWDNSAGGFIDNANPGALVFDHDTAWRNGGTGFDAADAAGTLTRNLAVANGTNQSLGGSSSSQNSWDIGGTWTFASTDASVITGPRTASGTIATSTFLRPANGADVGARL
jgi:hypothetical protein